MLDTGGTDLADLNVRNGVSVVGGSISNSWQDKQNHGTHVSGSAPRRIPRAVRARTCTRCKKAHRPTATRPFAPSPPSQVAGTISALNQGSGVYGVLPGVKVLPVKVLSDDGYGSMSDIMAGIDYVSTNDSLTGDARTRGPCLHKLFYALPFGNLNARVRTSQHWPASDAHSKRIRPPPHARRW